MSDGAKSRKRACESDIGAGFATAEPPSELAPDQGDDCNIRERETAAEIEIDAEYRRRLFGIRCLPGWARAGARRGARDWRRMALKALREKRRIESVSRRARQMQGRLELCPRAALR